MREDFSDVVSGASKERLNLNAMPEQCRVGDTIVIYKLDRLGRSLTHPVNLASKLPEEGRKTPSESERQHRHFHFSGEIDVQCLRVFGSGLKPDTISKSL